MVDISDLLKDKRLPYKLMNARVEDKELEITFPSGNYRIVPEFSYIKDDGKTWALYISAGDGGIAGCNTLRYEIPKGIKKIIVGEVNP